MFAAIVLIGCVIYGVCSAYINAKKKITDLSGYDKYETFLISFVTRIISSVIVIFIILYFLDDAETASNISKTTLNTPEFLRSSGSAIFNTLIVIRIIWFWVTMNGDD